MRRSAILQMSLRFVLGRGSGRGGRLRSAILGIGLSLVPLVVVIEVSDGMIQGITSRFLETGTYHLQGIALNTPSRETLNRLSSEAERGSEITHVFPERRGNGLLYSDAGRSGVTIRALEPSQWSEDPAMRRYMEVSAGAFDLSEERSIVVGRQMAQNLEVTVGDRVKLLTVRSLGGERMLPRVSSFRITGIVSSGYSELDRLWVFVPLERGLEVIPPESGRFVMGVKVGKPYALSNGLFGSSSETYTRRVLSELRQVFDERYRFFTWYSLEQSRYLSFRTTKNLLVFIMVLIVVVASVNISTALVMLYLDREPEIAILKSMGTSPGEIAAIFRLCGFVSGVIGTAVGVAVGLLVAVNINEVLRGIEFALNAVLAAAEWLMSPLRSVDLGAVDVFNAQFYLERIPIVIGMPELLAVAGGAIALATLASVVPARRAGRARPLEIMRRH
jgi:lipoprotein-releasing system permease protein